MAVQATTALLLIISGLFGSMVEAQMDSDFMLFSGAEERRLEQATDPQLLALAAKTNDMIIIRLSAASQSGVAQEGVNVAIDCFPWLSRFPGGSIEWSFIQLDEFGVPTGSGEPRVLTPNDDVVPPERIIVGGRFNRWLNITSTVIIQGAEDPDRKIFMCTVCVARGTPFEMCHTTNYTSRLIGAPPVVNETARNFCIQSGVDLTVQLDCEIPTTIPRPLPAPARAWFKDDELVYSASLDTAPDIDDFVMANPVLIPGVLTPDVFSATADGSIFYNTQVDNITLAMQLPPGTTIPQARALVFNGLLGNWTCVANNSLGTSSVTNVIRQCGDAPLIPNCPAPTLFPQSGSSVPPGCNVCIQEGTFVTLDCTVTAGAPPISYVWRNSTSGMELSNSPMFVVREPGDYMCSASNLDDIMNTAVSVLFFSPRAELTTRIAGRSTNGCERLDITDLQREALQNTTDTCIFVGETLEVDCISSDPDAVLELTSADGTVYPNATATIMVELDNIGAADTTFSCRITSVMGPCGMFEFTSTVEVYDPAKIDRQIDLDPLPNDHLGAGRPTDVVQRNNGSTVTLRCPTSGIPDENTTWSRVIENSRGCLMEVPIADLPPDPRFMVMQGSVDGLDDLILTITDLRFADEGSYVCRTRNIAGEDADVVSLIIDPGSPQWDPTEFSECNVSCRDGVRRRSVTCRNSRDRSLLPDFMCAQTVAPPPSSESCIDEFPQPCFLDPVWVPYPWSECSEGCKGGFRTRDVACQVPMTAAVRPNVDCHYLRRPPTFEFCPVTCCVEDEYPGFCRQVGPNRCGELIFQKFCCWTCLLTVIP